MDLSDFLLIDRPYDGTMLCPSVVCNTCNVAKWYISPENCLKKQIGCPTSTLWYQFGPPTTPILPKWGQWLHPQTLVLQIAAKQLQLATWLLLTACRNLPTPYPTVPSLTPYGHLFCQNMVPISAQNHCMLAGSMGGSPSDSWASCF